MSFRLVPRDEDIKILNITIINENIYSRLYARGVQTLSPIVSLSLCCSSNRMVSYCQNISDGNCLPYPIKSSAKTHIGFSAGTFLMNHLTTS